MIRLIESKLKDYESNFRDKFAQLAHRLSFAEDVKKYFFEKHGKHIEKFGGRGLVNAIDDEIAHALADKILYAEKDGKTGLQFTFHINQKRELLCRQS